MGSLPGHISDQKSPILPPSAALIKPLVAGHGLVYLIDPAEDTASEVDRSAEALLEQQRHGASATAAGFAVDHDLGGRVQLTEPPRQLAEGYQHRPGQLTDHRLDLLPDVEDEGCSS